MPLAAMAAATLRVRSLEHRSRPDRLIAIRVPLKTSGRRPRQSASWRQASSVTQASISVTTWLSSATEMKSAGLSSPRSGCSQRTSASMPARVPVRRSMTGW